jgi:uncharacterized protein
MTPQERELIDGLFQRLKAADTPQKDREAEDLIAKRVVELPASPYLLTQTVLVQDHALSAAQERIAQLENELKSARPAASAPAAGSSFLGGLLGRSRWNSQGAPEPAAPAPATPRSSVPITAPQAPLAPQAGFGGGGFLQSALTTAAGVAGGALLYDGLRGLLFHNPGPFGPYVGAGWGGGVPGGNVPGGNIYETNVVNYYGDDPRGGGGNDRTIDTSATPNDLSDGLQNASYDPSDNGFDTGNDYDSGSDFGGSDDQSV